MVTQTNDQSFGLPDVIVSKNSYEGNYTSITNACTALSGTGGIIGIKGTSASPFTEDFTLPANVSLIGLNGPEGNQAEIAGKITVSAAGTNNISNLKLTTNGDYSIEFTGANNVRLNVRNCFLDAADNTHGSFVNTGTSSANFYFCEGQATTGFAFYECGLTASNKLEYDSCLLYQDVGNTTVNTVSGGLLILRQCYHQGCITTSGSGEFRFLYTHFNPQTDQIILIHNSTAGANLRGVEQCLFKARSATTAAISIGAGATLDIRESSIFTSGATAITGAGTLNAGTLTFLSTSVVDTSTVTYMTMGPRVRTDTVMLGNNSLVKKEHRLKGPYFENLGISYDGGSGTFTVRGADADLSTTNPAYVTLPSSSTPGEQVIYEVTSNQTFIDDVGASEILNNLFGFGTGIAVTVDTPFFLYACSNDAEDTIGFGISRIPNISVAPAVADLGSASSATADVQGSIFLLNDPTLGDYDGNPVVCIGSFRMRMSASDDWTVQALGSGDGVGKFQENVSFSSPQGQFGANASTFCVDNGGTAPIWGINQQAYRWIDAHNGIVEVTTVLRNDGGADGAGAVTAQVTVPYNATAPVSNVAPLHGGSYVNIAGTVEYLATRVQNTGNVMQAYGKGGALATLQWADFINGSRNWENTLTYQAVV